MKKLVIFDLDGTLLNTIDDLGEATNYALRMTGFPTHAITSYPYMVGNGITRLIERALPDEARDENTVVRVREFFTDYYNTHMADNTVPYDGINRLLSDLTDRGIKVAVASNKYQAAVEMLVRHYFSDITWAAIEGQKPDVPVKPDPSIVFEILTKCPTPKSDVLYVGDSGIDIETARRACVASCGVTWGFRPVRELREAYAENIVDRPAEILELVE